MTVGQSRSIALWFEHGLPARLVHDGIRYRVSDQPTRLEDEIVPLTHPLVLEGWRFQGTAEDGTARVFDVREARGTWQLVAIYD